MKEGRVVAVCTSRNSGIPKLQRKYARITHYGFAGDYHAKKMRHSFGTGGQKPNIDRHISIVAQEVIDAINEELGLSLIPGSLGENITTSGLGDLSDIADGTIIHIGSVGTNVTLRVSQQNNPCSILSPLDKRIVKTLHKRRGILCSVMGSFGQIVCPDDTIVATDYRASSPRF